MSRQADIYLSDVTAISHHSQLIAQLLTHYCVSSTVYDTCWRDGKKADFWTVFVCQKLCHNHRVKNRGCFTSFDA